MRSQARPHSPERTARRSTRARPTPLFYSDAEAAALLSISVSMIRKLRRLGKLEHVYIGRSARIPAQALAAFCDGLRGER